MTPSTRALHRLAVIGALIAALGISACGRKGALDPPPSAAIEPDLAAPAERSPGALTPRAALHEPDGIGSATTIRRGLAPTPRGPDKRLPIDILLD
ncbi:MAG: lipoprotein [Pseudomonadota bacterium]|nr:lipoprotein [Pseudomonadota bacterium]